MKPAPRGEEGGMSKFIWEIKACGVLLLWATAALALPAQTKNAAPPAVAFTTLYSFNVANGYEPESSIVQAANGQLYGTTLQGGPSEEGSIFGLTTVGNLTFVYSFDGTDGGEPIAGLIQATDGNLYGTTFGDTIFKVTPAGAVTTLYSFCLQSGCPDGTAPSGGLIQGRNGNLYGTTQQGGANGDGTIFTITLSGSLTTLYSFTGADGSSPYAGLVQATNGNFYGTTQYGGANGRGAVFEITPSGKLTTLYAFCSHSRCTDGQQPTATLVQGSDGNFYGTTYYGGSSNNLNHCTSGCGTIFKITPTGALTTLHSFDETDGYMPVAGLILGTDGNFYGDTSEGGTGGYGTAFSITPVGRLTTLHNFCVQTCLDGGFPMGGLFQGTDGSFYGTAPAGGEYNAGTAFNVSVGLGPFVRTLPGSGKVGTKVKILGTDLAGAKNVKFNGKAASFTLKSKTLIVATVPNGATSGIVIVKLPGGTLSSNVPFYVLK
jgi:uncharacterized repeat protein (TIGR03803 family)